MWAVRVAAPALQNGKCSPAKSSGARSTTKTPNPEAAINPRASARNHPLGKVGHTSTAPAEISTPCKTNEAFIVARAAASSRNRRGQGAEIADVIVVKAVGAAPAGEDDRLRHEILHAEKPAPGAPHFVRFIAFIHSRATRRRRGCAKPEARRNRRPDHTPIAYPARAMRGANFSFGKT